MELGMGDMNGENGLVWGVWMRNGYLDGVADTDEG